ncbi:non-ribosomal peptide synthetase [Calothrix sp. HK-06]|nr:non-ribosomal peptide synthetase [Calothrix sp. HK-06]
MQKSNNLYESICVHQMFEEQVSKAPDSIAVVFEDKYLTYSQLNDKANQLAYYLRSLGVGTEILVGICLERSLEMIVGILGILKAGAAYVPLDPTYPIERLDFILKDTQAPFVLTQKKLVKNLPSGAQVVCLDSDWELIAQNICSNPVCETKSNNLIYVIYTSGSTGKPKGVMVHHCGVRNLLEWSQTTFKLTNTDKLLQTFSFSFDPSVVQIFWTLCFGAQLVMARPGGHQDTAYLVKTVKEQQITVLNLVPSILRMLLEEEGISECRSLRQVTVGGEALSGQLIELFFACMKNLDWSLESALVNYYGPTETSIASTYWICQRGNNYSVAPIGKPIANTEIYILDENLQLVPAGEAGELHIGGIGLARGYLNRPDLTKEKFISNPYSQQPEARLYKTGDLVRYGSDGNLEFLGRIDHQVKIRGFRIELGEIEAILQQHPALQQSLVMAREDNSGNKRLVAYVVANPLNITNPSELRRYLLDKLPEYMAPAAFVFLDALPLNPNGKVDLRALPAPDTSSFVSNDFVAPRTDTEALLVKIWRQVLRLEQIGINDNFFEMGGDSLLAMQIISRCRQSFDVEVSLNLLFEKPTISSFAEAIVQTNLYSTKNLDNQIPQLVNRQSAPLSFAQQRMWFVNQLEPNSGAYLVTSAKRLQGKLSLNILQQSLDAIAAHHETIRTNFITSDDGNLIQVIRAPRPIEMKVINLTQEQSKDEQAQRILNQESRRPFNLTSDLMLRATLIQIDEQEHILLLVMHHIASDGWSTAILWQQLANVYKAILNNKPFAGAQLSIQYADFAAWQRQWLSGEVLNTQLNYWKNQLAGTLPLLELPTDKPRPSVQNYQGEYQHTVISKKLTEALKRLSASVGSTLFMTLLAAFKTLLYRYTVQEDIIIGTPIAGRNQTVTEEMIGCFINTLALRTNLTGNPSFLELLGRVKKVAMSAYTHQDMPFEKLVEELQPERNLSRSPIFDVLFNFINTPSFSWEIPGLSVESLEVSEPESKFSMTLYVQENSDELSLKLVYQRSLFTTARINTLLNQYQYLLEQIVATPNNPINSYSLVTPESRLLLPDPSVILSAPQYELVPAMFTNWSKSIPEHVAIRMSERTWSYSELSKSADSLAKLLLSYGVKQGEVVAVLGSRSFGLIASMMGVLMSGGTLLTVDPNLPTSRQQVMLTEAKAKYLLYIGTQHDSLNTTHYQVICVNPDTAATNIKRDTCQITLPQISADDAAYVFFTSGTTGVPKGVLGRHSGLAHFLTWQRQTFGVNPQDRSAQLTGLSFDVVLRDVFLPLTSGATLCLPASGDELEPAKILSWLEREQISLLHTVPSLAQSWLVNVPSGVSLQSLRYIFFAGEPLKDTLVRHWRDLLGGEIINLYGPTETTLAKCYHRVIGDELKSVQPVGSPLPQTQALVLSENNQLCGMGEPGQIVIRTPFRSLGYINASQENQNKFIKNPFRNDEQDLIYYTGDRGRYCPDGFLEILGRLDRQVKINGVRIELREIETQLEQHPAVRSVVVVAREDQPGNRRLVAYIVSQEKQCTVDELRRTLREKLPKYMIPSVFVMLDTLPLTANGKINHQALPIPDQIKQIEETFVAPRNQLESQMRQIWEEVLGIQNIGIKDNFFDLGGHSLLAVSLFTQIEKKFGVSIPLATLFKSGTVESLAKIVSQQEQTEISWSSLVKIKTSGSKPPLFCIHPLGGEIFCYYDLAPHLGAEQPVYGLQPQGLDGKQTPYTRIEDMASHYIQEIQTVQPNGPYYLMGYSFGGAVAFEMAQQLLKLGQKVAFLCVLDSCRPGYSKRSPILKRVYLHIKYIVQGGLPYIKQKLVGWREWGTYHLKERYKHHLQVVHGISDDKHLKVIDANALASSQYIYQTYSGSVTLLRTKDENRDEAIAIEYDPQFGWGDVVTGELDVQYISGSHVNMFEQPHLELLAEKLKANLAKCSTT